jgi:flavin reductase (DIM6/NTAB) family NADH-FMN oxidoreductase RutF
MKSELERENFHAISYPKHTVLISCIDKHEVVNMITVAWHTPISINPPLYGVSIAPLRFSHTLIEKSAEFVINFLEYDFIEKIHFCGTKSGKNHDKMLACNLSYEPSVLIKTPRIKQGYAHLECTVYKSMPLGDHTFFIGTIKNAVIEKDLFKNNTINCNKVKPVLYMGNNIYTTTSNTQRKL